MTSKKRNSEASNRKKAWRRGKELEEPVLKENKSKGKKRRLLTGELTQRVGKFSSMSFHKSGSFSIPAILLSNCLKGIIYCPPDLRCQFLHL